MSKILMLILMLMCRKEVIDRNPEEFKIRCLKDIQSLFQGRNPFFAGYGNRPNVSYLFHHILSHYASLPLIVIFNFVLKHFLFPSKSKPKKVCEGILPGGRVPFAPTIFCILVVHSSVYSEIL